MKDIDIEPLASLVRCQGGSAFSPTLQGRRVGDIPFLKVSDLNLRANRWLITEANNYVAVADAEAIGGSVKPAGSVIFPKVGAAIHTNKKRVLSQPSYIDNNLMAVWSTDVSRCIPEYLHAYLLTVPLSELANHGPLPSINSSRVLALSIPLPSVEEQRRIAEVIRRVQQSIDVEEQLLDNSRDLKQATMQQLFTRGVAGVAPNDTPYGQFPDHWAVEFLGSCCTVQSGVTKGRQISTEDTLKVPYLRVANVQDGYLDLREVKTITIRRGELQRYLVRDGDVLLTEGGDLDKLGRGFIWRNQVKNCVHQNHIFAVRAHRDILLPEYLAYLVQSPYGRAYFLSVAHKTTNLASINSTKLKAFPVPIPPLDEQQDIASILAVIDRKIDVHDRKKSLLKDLFDTLLHDLVSGRSSVADIDVPSGRRSRVSERSRARVRTLDQRDAEDYVDLVRSAPADHLRMMWQLTRDSWAFTNEPERAESRLQRHAVRVHRR